MKVPVKKNSPCPAFAEGQISPLQGILIEKEFDSWLETLDATRKLPEAIWRDFGVVSIITLLNALRRGKSNPRVFLSPLRRRKSTCFRPRRKASPAY